MHLDDFDKRILGILEAEGRISWRKLAERISLSASACQRRVEAMQAAGMLRHFTVACDYVKQGYGVRAFVQVKVIRHDNSVTRQFREAVLAYPEVLSCYKITGNVDFMLDIVATDLQAFGAFTENKILYLPGVIDATSSIVLENLKEHRQALD